MNFCVNRKIKTTIGFFIMPQMQLPIFSEGSTPINQNIAFIRKNDKITYIYGHLPIFIHDVDDTASFQMITSQIYIVPERK